MTIHPKKLFLIDSLGASLTAFSLGIIMVEFEPLFGMPPNVLYILASIACLFAIYSFWSYLCLTKNWATFLKGIAIANLTYCCITMALVVYYYSRLTTLGLLYFILECIIVLVLVTIELKTAAKNA